MTRQVEAHHYCTHYNQDMRQCLIYDSPEKNARLIGVEYIVSEKVFQGLPDEEKKLWHTHEYEVKGGILFLPGVPKVAEVKELDEVLHFCLSSITKPLRWIQVLRSPNSCSIGHCISFECVSACELHMIY